MAIILVAVAISERLWFDLGPNVELVTVAGVLAGVLLGRRWGFMVVLIIMALTDLVIGNTVIMVFTWSVLGLIGWGGEYLRKWQGLKRVVAGGGYGLIAAVGFYLFTNFGVWLVGNLYPLTLAGLLRSYWMGVPFFRVHLLSSIVTVMGGLAAVELVGLLMKVKSRVKLLSELKTK